MLGMFWKASPEAYLCYNSSCPTLLFRRLEKMFYIFILRAEWNLSLIDLIMESWFNETLTLYQMHNSFSSYFKYHLIPIFFCHKSWLTDFFITGKLAFYWLKSSSPKWNNFRIFAAGRAKCLHMKKKKRFSIY